MSERTGYMITGSGYPPFCRDLARGKRVLLRETMALPDIVPVLWAEDDNGGAGYGTEEEALRVLAAMERDPRAAYAVRPMREEETRRPGGADLPIPHERREEEEPEEAAAPAPAFDPDTMVRGKRELMRALGWGWSAWERHWREMRDGASIPELSGRRHGAAYSVAKAMEIAARCEPRPRGICGRKALAETLGCPYSVIGTYWEKFSKAVVGRCGQFTVYDPAKAAKAWLEVQKWRETDDRRRFVTGNAAASRLLGKTDGYMNANSWCYRPALVRRTARGNVYEIAKLREILKERDRRQSVMGKRVWEMARANYRLAPNEVAGIRGAARLLGLTPACLQKHGDLLRGCETRKSWLTKIYDADRLRLAFKDVRSKGRGIRKRRGTA